MKRAVVFGAGGFIGNHLVDRLKSEGYWVRGVDLKHPPYSKTTADEFIVYDLRLERTGADFGWNFNDFLYYQDTGGYIVVDEVYQLAADMGGAGFVFTGLNDVDIMHNSAAININLVGILRNLSNKPKVFYSSSACIYPQEIQSDYGSVPSLEESHAYPANPDSEYGWEKLFSERLYLSLAKNTDCQVRIARFHNIFGPLGSWNNGREKAPAAMCRKVAQARMNGEVEIWGGGEQVRSFLYIDECIEGIRRLMKSNYDKPLNIGSAYPISINDLVNDVCKISGKAVTKKHLDSNAIGVAARCSSNVLIHRVLGWSPDSSPKGFEEGLKKTYEWISQNVYLGLKDFDQVLR